ncbi:MULTISPECIES: hypothetical protein [unclassified Pseudomonas]|uniref:hypothetical protein n=1 Tax=unclassified Pseudomonas TaxID=196821 RepID=UPI000BD3DDDE|nr:MULTISPECIES: hypothetical protein [unclassified Pseudomonas]PVZ19940.1 hypothetical protein F474_00531 [Pseudomonas sp. URIL14HWK12:I12]PVZ27006.1 hypothetical protein F470_00186 [Pseudomonas sp. URIL14HWK12:I10]PVZ37895.1 hypothetical protein F472_00531 [Pseudomonas sp. URIL14HWK12:I11]SNZ05238.1 hypothetical protein SAMN05660463_00873 [Pseudomonas sp. URIL14HWK12:I9]
MPDIPNWVWVGLGWSQYGWLGVVGGVASYFYSKSTEPRFDVRMFVSKLVLAFFVGKVSSEFIPSTDTYKSGYIMLLGFFAYPVLAVLEVKVKGWVENYNPRGPP